MNEHGDFFLLHNFGVQIVPFKLAKKKFIQGKKDMAKSVHKARYSIAQVMTLKATTRTF